MYFCKITVAFKIDVAASLLIAIKYLWNGWIAWTTSNYILNELWSFGGGETNSSVRFLRYSVKWEHFKVSGER